MAAAIRATNADGALEASAGRALARLESISLPEPLVTKAEISHSERIVDHLVRLLPQASEIEVDAEVLVADALHYVGRLVDAIIRYEAAAERASRLFGQEDSKTLVVRNNLAGAYLAAGRHAEAIEMLEETLRVREETLGAEHLDELGSRINLTTA